MEDEHITGLDSDWEPLSGPNPNIHVGKWLARIASLLDEGGVDHVLWSYTVNILHGSCIIYDTDEFHFVVPDNQLHRAIKLLLFPANGDLKLDPHPCRGQKDCPILHGRENPYSKTMKPRPAQHIHCAIDLPPYYRYPGCICLYKQSALLPWMSSLKACSPPPDGSPGSAWGVVPADVYRHYFWGWSHRSRKENPSLYPLRLLPPHRLSEALLKLMCREEPGSKEELWWFRKWSDMFSNYYRPNMRESEKIRRTCVLDPGLLPPSHQKFYQREICGIEPLTSAERRNELREAEGCPLEYTGLPPELNPDKDSVAAAAVAEEERRGGDHDAGGKGQNRSPRIGPKDLTEFLLKRYKEKKAEEEDE